MIPETSCSYESSGEKTRNHWVWCTYPHKEPNTDTKNKRFMLGIRKRAMIKSLVVVHGIVLTDSCLGAMATYICVYTNSTCMYIYIYVSFMTLMTIWTWKIWIPCIGNINLSPGLHVWGSFCCSKSLEEKNAETNHSLKADESVWIMTTNRDFKFLHVDLC